MNRRRRRVGRLLKGAAAQCRTSIGALIHTSQEACAVKTHESALTLVESARAHAALGEDAALELARDEVDKARRTMRLR
jgi:hypothetical protein